MDKIQEIFASRLKEIRRISHLSQGDLAKMANISQSNIARYETLKAEATISPLAKIAKALNITSDYLLGIEQKNKEELNEIEVKQQKLIKTILNLSESNQEKVLEYVLMLEVIEHISQDK